MGEIPVFGERGEEKVGGHPSSEMTARMIGKKNEKKIQEKIQKKNEKKK